VPQCTCTSSGKDELVICVADIGRDGSRWEGEGYRKFVRNNERVAVHFELHGAALVAHTALPIRFFYLVMYHLSFQLCFTY
jgi:hypothetical protein